MAFSNCFLFFLSKNYVQAHKGIEGNEEADTLAKAGAAKFQRKESVRYKPY